MEYGYEMVDTAGNKTFFVEGCTYCSLSTGGLHERHCSLFGQPPTRYLSRRGEPLYLLPETHEERFMDNNLFEFYKKKGYLKPQELPKEE